MVKKTVILVKTSEQKGNNLYTPENLHNKHTIIINKQGSRHNSKSTFSLFFCLQFDDLLIIITLRQKKLYNNFLFFLSI